VGRSRSAGRGGSPVTGRRYVIEAGLRSVAAGASDDLLRVRVPDWAGPDNGGAMPRSAESEDDLVEHLRLDLERWTRCTARRFEQRNTPDPTPRRPRPVAERAIRAHSETTQPPVSLVIMPTLHGDPMGPHTFRDPPLDARSGLDLRAPEVDDASGDPAAVVELSRLLSRSTRGRNETGCDWSERRAHAPKTDATAHKFARDRAAGARRDRS
jgi:hypothetical protein